MTTIQILGINESEATTKLRGNVIQALEEMGTKAVVEQVTDVDKFIQYKINGIPALILNGTVVLQKEVPSVEDLKILFKVLASPSENLIKMKNILVPTDFSTAARDAYQFALELAKIQDGKVKVAHVYHIEYDPQNPYLTEPSLSLKKVNEERLEKFIAESALPGAEGKRPPNVSSELVMGFPVEEILEAACSDGTDLIVLGTTGEKGLLEKLFGSVSTNVAQKAKCPVLLVPQGVKFNDFKQILYASDFESASESTIEKLVDLADIFKANIHFVHVLSEGDEKDYKEIENQLFRILFKGSEPSFSFTMSKVEGGSVIEGLNDYAMHHQIDLVVLVSPHRSFWEALFHKSVTKAMALNTHLPILVLHPQAES